MSKLVVLTLLVTTLRVMAVPPAPPPTPFGTAPRMLHSWGSYGEGAGQFIYVADLVVDRRGDVYALDSNRSLVRKYDSNGTILLEWGSRGDGPGQFRNPVALGVDDRGHLYVADVGRDCIHKFTDGGQFLARWGTKGSRPGEFSSPSSIAVDSAGSVFVVDRFNHRIQQFTPDGGFLAQWGRRGTEPGEFQEPVGIAIDAAGDVFVADYAVGGVQKFTARGNFVASWRTKRHDPDDYTYAFGLATDDRGHIYLADNRREQVEEYTGRGTLVRAWTPSGTGGRLLQPGSIKVDRAGDVYLVGRIDSDAFGSVTLAKFGFGPTRAERLPARAYGSLDPVNALLDRLEAMPLGEKFKAASPSRRCALAQRGADPVAGRDRWVIRCRDEMPPGVFEARGYLLGYSAEPRLERASWSSTSVSDSSIDSNELFAAWSDLLSRRLGRAATASRAFALPAATLHLSQVQSGEGARTRPVRLELASDAITAAESAPPDTCDLRLFEGLPYARASVRRDLARALAARPEVAAALRRIPVSIADLADIERALADAVRPGIGREEHDLLHLAADGWLAALGSQEDTSTVARLRASLSRHGVGFRPDSDWGWAVYCGSLLPPLAARAGTNAWADRAFLLLLELGWDATCTADYEGATFANEIYHPIVKRGESFLERHPKSEIWPAVALRVALAHETAWSLSFGSGPNDYPDYTVGADGHRARAIELYQALVPRVADARFAAAIRARIRSLQRGVDSGCRVYYLPSGC